MKQPNTAAETNVASAPSTVPANEAAPLSPPPGVTGAPTQVAAAPCKSGDLGLTRVATDAGAGQRVVAYALVNNGRAPCDLRGYPTVQLFDVDGKRLEGAEVVQTEANTLNTGGPAQEVTVQPNGRAVFFLAFTGIPVSDKPCLAVARVQVVPPGNTQAIEVQDTLQVCGGQVRVTPVRTDVGSPAASSRTTVKR